MNWRKHWSVRLHGLYSGSLSPALTFLRWRTREQAEAWIAQVEERDRLRFGPLSASTRWEPVDLREQR